MVEVVVVVVDGVLEFDLASDGRGGNGVGESDRCCCCAVVVAVVTAAVAAGAAVGAGAVGAGAGAGAGARCGDNERGVVGKGNAFASDLAVSLVESILATHDLQYHS